MQILRRFTVRHSRFFEEFYNVMERIMIAFDPLSRRIGYNRVERPVAMFEKLVKGLLFDCRMCGQCVLSSTGMSCPMNCPKNLRNGPCGGVRPGGLCEVMPKMRCVWVEAWQGAERMKYGTERIKVVQPPVNRELEGSSSWLRVVREKAAHQHSLRLSSDRSKHAIAQAFRSAREIEPAAAPLTVEPQTALSEQAVKESTAVFDEAKENRHKK